MTWLSCLAAHGLPSPGSRSRNARQMKSACQPTYRSSRGGLTLVELMVTLIVMVILASLTLGGLATSRSSARAAKTTSTIRKISELVLPYYELYETRRPRLPSAPGLSRADTTNLRRIAIRRLMTMELPERSRDVLDVIAGPSGTSIGVTLSEVTPVARRYMAIMQPALSQKPPNFNLETVFDPISSSDFLHMIVMRGPIADPDIVMHFRTDEIADTNGNGLPEFIDGWGEPIFFKRWPVGFRSAAQPIDGLGSSVDEAFSDTGHRLVPLIFSGGMDRSPDIEAATAARYSTCNFNPFAFLEPGYNNNQARLLHPKPTSPLAGAVVLVPVAGERRVIATRWMPQNPPPAWFVPAGCESDTNGNGFLESYDNIHNHDMTR
jgi:prepilin-type N-terminal cleavage/methylation domain-containing protein